MPGIPKPGTWKEAEDNFIVLSVSDVDEVQTLLVRMPHDSALGRLLQTYVKNSTKFESGSEARLVMHSLQHGDLDPTRTPAYYGLCAHEDIVIAEVSPRTVQQDNEGSVHMVKSFPLRIFLARFLLDSVQIRRRFPLDSP